MGPGDHRKHNACLESLWLIYKTKQKTKNICLAIFIPWNIRPKLCIEEYNIQCQLIQLLTESSLSKAKDTEWLGQLHQACAGWLFDLYHK